MLATQRQDMSFNMRKLCVFRVLGIATCQSVEGRRESLKSGEPVCCTHVQIVYVTNTAAPRNEGKHNREMNSVVIWLALQGFLEAWQLSSRLLWWEKPQHNVERHAHLNTNTAWCRSACRTDLLHVKEHNQFYDLHRRKQRRKQHPEPEDEPQTIVFSSVLMLNKWWGFKDVVWLPS